MPSHPTYSKGRIMLTYAYRRTRAAVGALLAALLLATGSVVAAEMPRLVIAPLKMPVKLTTVERKLLGEVDLVGIISEGLTDSRSFRIQVRDEAGVQALLHEKQVQASPLARGRAGEGERRSAVAGSTRSDAAIGLDATNYILEPTLQLFTISTRFEKQELIAGMYDRIDTAQLQLAVRIIDLGGNVVFQETVHANPKFGRREATEEDKRRAQPPPLAPIRDAVTKAARSVVDAIVARINPITVLDVQGKTLVIDRGSKNGFDDNTVFSVYGEARQVANKTTGAMHLIPGRLIGKAKVIALHEDVAELEMTEGDAAGVTAGAIVRVSR
jgi:hypothetical protein